MLTDMRTFAFSEQVLTHRRRYVRIVMATLIILMIFIFLLITDFELRAILDLSLFMAPFLAILVVIMIVVSRFTLRQLSQMSLSLTFTGLVRTAGKHQQSIAWQDITKLRVRQNPQGEIQVIEVIPVTQRPLQLFGFEPMTEVLQLLQERMSTTVPVEMKRTKVNGENPLVFVGVMVVALAVFEGLRRTGGAFVYQNVVAILQFGFGSFLLWYGPTSRANPNLRKVEVISGILILGGSFMLLALKVVEWLGWIS